MGGALVLRRPFGAHLALRLPAGNVVASAETGAAMILAPLPLLWRRADAFARVGAKALITCGRVGDFKYGQFGMRVAAEVFAIRYVCGFGANLPDGVVPFDDLFTADKLDPIPPLER